MSIRPMPYGARLRVERRDQLGERQLLAVERHRHARLEADHDLDAAPARRRGDDVSANASSGGATHGSSSMPASIARPKRLSSIEYGDSCFASTGMPRASAYAISSSRDQMLVAQRRDHAARPGSAP